MTDEEYANEFRKELKNLLDKYGKVFHEDGAFCTAYFVAAEFFDGDGKYWSSSFYEEDVPFWHVTGLVNHCLEDVGTEEEEEEE